MGSGGLFLFLFFLNLAETAALAASMQFTALVVILTLPDTATLLDTYIDFKYAMI